MSHINGTNNWYYTQLARNKLGWPIHSYSTASSSTDPIQMAQMAEEGEASWCPRVDQQKTTAEDHRWRPQLQAHEEGGLM